MEAAVNGNSTLTDDERYDLAMDLGARIRDTTGDAAAAVRAFRLAERTARRGMKTIAARVATAEALLLLGGDARTAEKLLETAVEALGERESRTARTAWMRLGDARMQLGEGAKAREAYETADRLAGGPEDVRRMLRKAAAARTAMTLSDQGEGARALEAVTEWEELAPMDRFTGLLRIERARALLLLDRADEASRELTALVAGNPESEYADRALFMLAGIEEKAGRGEKAAEYRERLKEEYPWSPLNK
jgi:ATP/maltotriose-dependent transcriptional regulator MalT